MGRLQDKIAFITGGASGIGFATAQRFAKEGATVLTNDIVGDADYLFDVRDEQAIAATVTDIVAKHGRIDVLVNAAGVAGGGPVHLVGVDEWDRVVDINLKGTFLVCKHVCQQMIGQKSGSVVNISSIEGIEGTEGGSAYNASKGGVIMLTKSMAIDYGKNGIRVNAVCPGGVRTPLLLGLIDQPGMEAYKETMLKAHALGRFGEPEEIANAVLFLASSEASFMTGTAMVVDGGMTAGLNPRLFPQFLISGVDDARRRPHTHDARGPTSSRDLCHGGLPRGGPVGAPRRWHGRDQGGLSPGTGLPGHVDRHAARLRLREDLHRRGPDLPRATTSRASERLKRHAGRARPRHPGTTAGVLLALMYPTTSQPNSGQPRSLDQRKVHG